MEKVENTLDIRNRVQQGINKLNDNGCGGMVGKLSDGYHSFDELYEFRKLYNAALFNEWFKKGLYDVHKSKKHNDGEICFGDEKWFIVVAQLPTGQISNHYNMSDWDLFKCEETEKAKNPFDGHTPNDVLERIEDAIKRQ